MHHHVAATQQGNDASLELGGLVDDGHEGVEVHGACQVAYHCLELVA